MAHDAVLRSRDPDGLVHHVTTTSFPVLLADNNVDYVDLLTTFCSRCADAWPEASPGELTTCLACFAAWLEFESMVVDYFGSLEMGLRVGFRR